LVVDSSHCNLFVKQICNVHLFIKSAALSRLLSLLDEFLNGRELWVDLISEKAFLLSTVPCEQMFESRHIELSLAVRGAFCLSGQLGKGTYLFEQ